MTMTEQGGDLWQHRLSDFRDTVAREPMPGCGATAVVSADLGLALVLKGLNLSQQHGTSAPRQALIEEGESLKTRLAPLADEDIAAFEAFMAAVGRDENDDGRRDALHEAAENAVEVPLKTARLCDAALALAHQASDHIEAQFLSDAVAGARLIHAALHSVLLNVSANAGQLGSDTKRDRALYARNGLAHRADALLATITADASD
ncbi:cyclodeaminase/cyclohydrolase family protein [Larsenimonas suaedae]|uniref:Cyclodeaminase/cyclohydrolase family protein n=1 Tax=Larsenimonas suaedae TaxID=1851019 RepID=A0ABU1GRE7_9GAMM|nr:cyclodeaminase/cyclohydrolase family protein [Larsenimonas suaedae]MCM2972605.1 cyclodeaminase/cyclohydrolase family protein [Larsenimonas suaedae]MDR5894599.1 cyclodeaminase/cyclohydrolase family protein [Larsenimonas suaedae]